MDVYWPWDMRLVDVVIVITLLEAVLLAAHRAGPGEPAVSCS